MLKDVLYSSKVLDGLFTENDFSFLNSADSEISELNKDLKNQKIKREQIINFLNNFDNNQGLASIEESKEIFELINNNIKNQYKLQEEFQQLEKYIVEFIVDLENNNYQGNDSIVEIKSKVNSYSNLYKDLTNAISFNNTRIDDFFNKVNIKIEVQTNIKEADIRISGSNKTLSSNIKDNLVLVVSETQKKVFLPYTRDEILGFMKKYPDDYLNGEDVIEQEFIAPISTYSKHPALARFREAYSLIRDREMKSIMEAFKYAIDLMFKYELNPAIIAACKSEKQLNDYLHCLETNTLNDFKHFGIKFEIAPLAVKNNNLI